MTTVSLDEAQAKLAELVENLAPGDEVVITKNNRPVAQLTPIAAQFGQPVPGRCKGMLTIHSEDDDHLKDWGGVNAVKVLLSVVDAASIRRE